MNTARLVKILLVSFAVVACTNSESADGDEAEGALENGAACVDSHLVAVGKCTAANKKASENAIDTNSMIQAEAAFSDCLKRTNDAAVSAIEKKLAAAGSTSKGKTSALFTAFRRAGDQLCEEEGRTSDNFGGSAARAEDASCRASREQFLASLIDAYTGVGEESVRIPEDRARHKSCYRKFDKRFEASESTNNAIQASAELFNCIWNRTTMVNLPFAKAQVETDPSAGTVDAAYQRVLGATKTFLDRGVELCTALNEADDNGKLSVVATEGCKAHIAEQIFAAVHFPFEKE